MIPVTLKVGAEVLRAFPIACDPGDGSVICTLPSVNNAPPFTASL